VTRQFVAKANPGMRRLTPCNPKPTMPKRIIGTSKPEIRSEESAAC
jgi:hypothetical protein